jgi:hypothetical protein
MSARLANASVIRECTLETCKSSCISKVAKPFFIPVVHSPLRVVGHVVAPEISPRGDRARSHGTRGSAGAHLGRKARSRAKGHMAALELISARRQVLGPRDTWQRQNPPRQGGEVRGRGTRGSAGAHLGSEVRFGATRYMAAPEPTSIGR